MPYAPPPFRPGDLRKDPQAVAPYVGAFGQSPWKSRLVMGVTGMLWKLVLASPLVGRVQVARLDAFVRFLERREAEPEPRPLVSVMNHTSVLDDPMYWGLMPPRFLFAPARMRWTITAQELTFGNPVLAHFFGAGQALPVVRGYGIYQPGVDRAISYLARGGWVNLFPEGYVTPHGLRRFKWGVARLLLSQDRAPLLVPIAHAGTEEFCSEDRRVLGIQWPRWGKPLTIVFGEPIDTAPWIAEVRAEHAEYEDQLRALTARCQEALAGTLAEAQAYHKTGEFCPRERLALA